MEPRALAELEVILTGSMVIISSQIGGIEAKALTKSEVILLGLGVNDYCLSLSMRLIFASTDIVGC